MASYNLVITVKKPNVENIMAELEKVIKVNNFNHFPNPDNTLFVFASGILGNISESDFERSIINVMPKKYNIYITYRDLTSIHHRHLGNLK